MANLTAKSFISSGFCFGFNFDVIVMSRILSVVVPWELLQSLTMEFFFEG